MYYFIFITEYIHIKGSIIQLNLRIRNVWIHYITQALSIMYFLNPHHPRKYIVALEILGNPYSMNIQLYLGKCTEIFDLSAASASSTDNSCFARLLYTFQNEVVCIVFTRCTNGFIREGWGIYRLLYMNLVCKVRKTIHFCTPERFGDKISKTLF